MRVGHHVWVGMKIIITLGISIGSNAIIGPGVLSGGFVRGFCPGAVVTKDMVSEPIEAVNPARQVKQRFGNNVETKHFYNIVDVLINNAPSDYGI